MGIVDTSFFSPLQVWATRQTSALQIVYYLQSAMGAAAPPALLSRLLHRNKMPFSRYHTLQTGDLFYQQTRSLHLPNTAHHSKLLGRVVLVPTIRILLNPLSPLRRASATQVSWGNTELVSTLHLWLLSHVNWLAAQGMFHFITDQATTLCQLDTSHQ